MLELREPERDGKVLGDHHRQDVNVAVLILIGAVGNLLD